MFANYLKMYSDTYRCKYTIPYALLTDWMHESILRMISMLEGAIAHHIQLHRQNENKAMGANGRAKADAIYQ